MKTEVRGSATTTSISLQNPNNYSNNTNNLFINTPQGSLAGALRGCLGSLDGGCIEKLLLHCASALERNDVTLAQQVMWVLNNVASSVGDPNQRLTSWFLRALISRASRICPTPTNSTTTSTTEMSLSRSSSPSSSNGVVQRRLMSVTELAGRYVDLIPWHRFGYCASNSLIFKAIQGYNKVHILDFSITYCMQWPTLIDALAKRPEGPPSLRVTVPSFRPPVPPLLNMSCEEVGLRLANFSKFRQVPFEFNVIGNSSPNYSSNSPNSSPEVVTLSSSSSSTNDIVSDEEYNSSTYQFELLLTHLNASSLNLQDDEALVVNFQNWLRYLPDIGPDHHPHHHKDIGNNYNYSLRDTFLNAIKGLNPRIVVVVDEDSDLNASSLTSRITTCFNYLWIPFDALETFLPKDSCQRIEYESDIGHKIENIIGFEGFQRIERLESGATLYRRMRNAGFLSIPFSEDTIKEVKALLDEHASGWGMKKEEEDHMLVLTWKGHNSVFSTAWVPMITNLAEDSMG
ncbi:scarecrow-like protein 32 [Humulus lupulus]|uniref:scarecrow-like protein 32 n=1 Tax=Humulus lupulus TaxID=3486 RepID=UPI002B413608|nr:scarecrow-like protein 32 [Humulus lupulus]